MSVLDRDRTVAPPGYSRWLIPPAALAVHLSIGQVYAFSVFKTPLQDHFGTEGTPIAVIFSIAIVMLGLSAAFGGTWVERHAPRKTTVASALCFCGGLFIASGGVASDRQRRRGRRPVPAAAAGDGGGAGGRIRGQRPRQAGRPALP